ncbi:cytochrome P450 [Powellomyces hirtus]|nr:cytochrome P450 [Powellomyces hirtus]
MGLLTVAALTFGVLLVRYLYQVLALHKVRVNSTTGKLVPPELPDLIPILGPLTGLSYLLDPLAFVQANHARFGDIFSCTVLGKTLTFVRGQPLIQAYASASESELSLLEAYKVILGKLVGPDVFQKIGREIYSALSASRVEKILPVLTSMSVKEVDRAFSQAERGVIDIAEFINVTVVKIAVTVLCSEDTSRNFSDQLAKDLNLLQSDHSTLAIIANWETATTRRRAAAKERILTTFRNVALEHLKKLKAGENCEGFVSYLIHYRFGTEKPSGNPESTSLPHPFVPREMDQEEYKSNMNGLVLLLYGMVFGAHTNTVMSTLSILLDLLQSPETLRAVLDEADSLPGLTSPGFSLKNHVQLNRACTESWRLRSAGGLWRRVRGDQFSLGEYSLKKGTLVSINQGVINQDQTLYAAETISFDPTRYGRTDGKPLDMDPLTQSPSTSAKNVESTSFGIGRHLCPGRLLAYRIVGCIVLSILRYDMTIVKAPSRWARLPIAGIDRAIGDSHLRIGQKIRGTS